MPFVEGRERAEASGSTEFEHHVSDITPDFTAPDVFAQASHQSVQVHYNQIDVKTFCSVCGVFEKTLNTFEFGIKESFLRIFRPTIIF